MTALTGLAKQKARDRSARWRARHPEKRTPYDPTYRLRAPWVRSLGPRQADAKKRGIPFTLRVVDVKAVWTGKCAVTGLDFDLAPSAVRGPRPFSPSMDRIVPSKGYVPGNIRFILQCVNAFKGTMSDAEMQRVAAEIVRRGTLSTSGSQADKALTPAA